MRETRFAFATLASLAALLLAGAPARADGLSRAEMAQLLRGESVARAQALDAGEHHYVGGVAYSILDDSAADVADLVSNVAVWQRILPKTRSARQVGSVHGDALVELTNGTTLVQATYTMRVQRDGRAVRFWMDPSRRHDIDDAWGFVRAEPLPDGRALVTYGILIDIGSGLVRDLFETRVRALAMSVPERLRDLVEERAAAGRRASW